jgi:rfaE bifunctional protein kinase chain/domain
VVIDPDRATTVKTRILAEGAAQPQQMARIDRQDRAPVAGAVEEKVCEAIRELAGDASAVLVSDYKSGVITHPVLETIRGVSIPGRLTSVDSQGDLHRFAGFRVVRGHARDVERAVGYQLVGEDDFQMAAEHLLRALSAELVVISRSRDGMSLATRDGGYFHVPAANLTEVYDVTGAGDTSIAVLSLALLAGASAVQAAWLASCAAGLTVRRIGVAAPSMDELLEAAKALPPAVQGAG